MSDEIVVTAAVRTAIGDFGGALASVPPTQLGSTVVRALLDRTGLPGSEVGHVVFGNVIHTEPRDMYLSRVAALEGGVSEDAPALTLNRLCGSGLQAIISAAQAIALGDTDIAIGAGAESMSRAAYVAASARWGSRMGDIRLIDMMVGALTDPFSACHMGMTAENVAKKYGISREDQDRLAAESHRRAAQAIHDGHFRLQIVPVTQRSKKGETVFDTDEHRRRPGHRSHFRARLALSVSGYPLSHRE